MLYPSLLIYHAEFRIVQVEHDRVFIIDPDQGSKTITNDAEWVYEQIQKNYPNHRLIYRDTMNNWDEIVPSDKNQNIPSVYFKPYKEHTPF